VREAARWGYRVLLPDTFATGVILKYDFTHVLRADSWPTPQWCSTVAARTRTYEASRMVSGMLVGLRSRDSKVDICPSIVLLGCPAFLSLAPVRAKAAMNGSQIRESDTEGTLRKKTRS
jgi:hypothetical protein